MFAIFYSKPQDGSFTNVAQLNGLIICFPLAFNVADTRDLAVSEPRATGTPTISSHNYMVCSAHRLAVLPTFFKMSAPYIPARRDQVPGWVMSSSYDSHTVRQSRMSMSHPSERYKSGPAVYSVLYCLNDIF